MTNNLNETFSNGAPVEKMSGWKPLPVIFKIIWILLLIGAVFSIFGVFSAPSQGFMIFGKNIYGLWAANTMFGINILAPVILLVAMFKRYTWTWIWGVFLFVFMIINESMMIGNLSESVEQIVASFPEEYLDLVPDLYQMVHISVIAGVVLGLMVDLFFLISFIVKRRYFSQQ